MSELASMSLVSTLGAVSTMSAVSTMGAVPTMEAAPTMGVVSTMEVVSILDIEIFEGVPLWLVGFVICVFLAIILLILMISWVFHAEKVVKKKTHHAPSSHEVVIELQKELLRSMEASSRQNWLMIWLTIIFITVSVLGGAVVLNLFQGVREAVAAWFAQFIEYLNSTPTQ